MPFVEMNWSAKFAATKGSDVLLYSLVRGKFVPSLTPKGFLGITQHALPLQMLQYSCTVALQKISYHII